MKSNSTLRKSCCCFSATKNGVWCALFLPAFFGRIILLLIANYFDSISTGVKFQDIDYVIFSEGANQVYNGKSPYLAPTYRYTPLVAYMALVNNVIHKEACKYLFIICDILLGLILFKISERGTQSYTKLYSYVAFIALNPLFATNSTRGSNDNIVVLLVYGTLYFILKKQYVLAGLIYGLSVHFKIFPIIYSIPFYLFIDMNHTLIKQKQILRAITTNLITKNRLTFTICSIFSFLTITSVFYYIYGFEFLYETYLYHLIRKDNRHNHSFYWSIMYYTYDLESSKLISLLLFIPQWTLVIFIGLFFHYDLYFAILIQTAAFVFYNKVITAQYIIWYFSFIPLVLPTHPFGNEKWYMVIPLTLLFLSGLIAFGKPAHAFEFEFKGQLWDIQIGCFFYHIANVFEALLFVYYHKLSITKTLVENEGKKIKDY